jgi:hypothetical protein
MSYLRFEASSRCVPSRREARGGESAHSEIRFIFSQDARGSGETAREARALELSVVQKFAVAQNLELEQIALLKTKSTTS